MAELQPRRGRRRWVPKADECYNFGSQMLGPAPSFATTAVTVAVDAESMEVQELQPAARKAGTG